MKLVKAPSFTSLTNAAVDAAHAAGKVLRKYYRTHSSSGALNVREKKGAGLVTNADTEAEAAAIRILRKAFPKFSYLAEESAPTGSPETSDSEDSDPSHRGRWVLDPLDGTTNFVHGFPMFCVSIAAVWEEQVVAGVIYHPVLDETYWATRGKGAWRNSKRIQVSKTRRLTDSLLTTGFTYRRDELRLEMAAFERLSEIARAIRRPGSAALDLAYTASGNFDGFWERNLSPWDVAAGSLLVEEAGGKVSDFEGRPFQLNSPTILASNGTLHGPLLQAIAPESCPLPPSRRTTGSV